MKKALWLLCAGIALVAAPAHAQNDVRDFYRGKRMTLLVQYSPGGTFDLRARWLARHLPALTGARTIVRNVPGGGGVAGYNRLYRLPPDGLALLTAHTKLVAFDLFGSKGVRYDFDKFRYLGRVVRTNTALLVRKDLPSDIEGLRKLKRIRIGASSPFNEGMIAEMFDLPITIVPGYGGSAERLAAIRRGELDATTGSVATAWRHKDAVNVAFTFFEDDRTPDAPHLMAMQANEPWRSYALSFSEIFGAVITSPGVPEARTKFLGEALEKVTRVEAARKEADKLKLIVQWTGPEDLKKTLKPFLDLDGKATEELKLVIERKYVGKLR